MAGSPELKAPEITGSAGGAAASDGSAVRPADMQRYLRMLGSRRPGVRAQAAEALGHAGDPRAVPALLSALRRRSLIRSPAGERRVENTLWVLYFLLFLSLPIFPHPVTALLLLVVAQTAVALGHRWREAYREEADTVAILEALERIAAAQPQPELRQGLADVRAIAENSSSPPATARAAERAAVRIDAVTAKLRDLPRPAEAPSVTTLPVAGNPPAPVSAELPLPQPAEPPQES